MKRDLTVAAASLALMILWGAWVLAATFHAWWRAPMAAPDDPDRFATAIISLIDSRLTGNAAFLMVEDWRPYREHYASTGDPVNGDTLFQVASLSKWIAAWGVLILVQEGRLDLDAPVSRYLSRWSLPTSDFGNEGVTVRRLLSHTAGLTDGLGYAGFAPGDPVQTTEESLTHARDAMPGADGRVRVGHLPGDEWRYSGGGYTLLQLLVEEASGTDFNTFMKRRVFEPLGMSRSTFILDGETTNLATFYDNEGNLATHYRFAALAAASLYTSTRDLVRFFRAHRENRTVHTPVGMLQQASVEAMRTPQASMLGIPIWGLGTILYAPDGRGDFIIGHDGNNYPAINTTARLNPSTGDGVIVMESGNSGLATDVGREWVFWQTGLVDRPTIGQKLSEVAAICASGWVAITCAALLILRRARRTPAPRS